MTGSIAGRLRFSAAAAMLLVCAIPAVAADNPPSRIEITLERKRGADWQAVEPGLVLDSGDVIRFRFKANFNGYLYVTNYGTSGQAMVLFPREETGQGNVIRPGQDYTVPSNDAVFRITGPAGYESVYWYLSPIPLPDKLVLPSRRPANYKPPVLTPRCDETMFRSQSRCIDFSAGPRAVQEKDKLPAGLAPMRSTRSRELDIVQKREQSVLTPSGPASAPVLYEFRVAHK